MGQETSLHSTASVAKQTGQSTFGSVFQRYFKLTKPTIVLMVVVTTLGGLALAAETFISPTIVIATLIGTWLSASSASVFNHIIDVNIDQAMARTRGRPIASGLASRREAFWFGLTLGILSFAVLATWTTLLAAWIGLAGNIFYVVIYTWYLKPRTVQNIVIGGAAGSVGPLIGWAAVRGDVGLPAWLLFLLIFLWTPPHFWALALKYKEDYRNAKVPMLPVIKGDEYTRLHILLYTLTLLPIFPILYWMDMTGFWGFAICFLLTAYFSWLAYKLWYSHNNDQAMPVFHYSCIYVLLVFLVLAGDKVVLLLT